MTENVNDLFPVLLERRLKMQRSLGDDLADVVIEIGHP